MTTGRRFPLIRLFASLSLALLTALTVAGCAAGPQTTAAAPPSAEDQKIYQDASDQFTGTGTVPPGKAAAGAADEKIYQDASDRFTGPGTVPPGKPTPDISREQLYRDSADRF